MIGLVSAFICVHLWFNLMVRFFNHGLHGLTRIRKKIGRAIGFIRVSVLQCGRMNQHVGSNFKTRWLLQAGCAQSARLLFAASVRKQAGATNLGN
jgi:hypothetical protein